MKIAILGATSQIAKDLILSFSDEHELELFSREATAMGRWMVEHNLNNYHSRTYFDFPAVRGVDAIINFVGAGNPERVKKMGANIFNITETFDRMAMDYLEENRNCLYIFLSSGAAFGDNFHTPADTQKNALFPINNVQPEHYYGLAKAMDAAGKRTPCYIQVNIGAEEQKGGCAIADVPALIASARDADIPLLGLMCVPPADVEPAPYFALLAKMAREEGLARLSMGMSGDYETAIMLGATDIRVGTALFGDRPVVQRPVPASGRGMVRNSLAR